jgi:hypothetical protein
MDQDISLPIPADWVDLIATLVAEKLAAEAPSPWMTRVAAAAYLGVPVARLEKDRAIPSHKWDGRVLYNRAELDQFLMERSR